MAIEHRWSICPVEDCTYAVEFDPNESLFCLTCEVELISECPSCKFKITKEDQMLCGECGAPLKE